MLSLLDVPSVATTNVADQKSIFYPPTTCHDVLCVRRHGTVREIVRDDMGPYTNATANRLHNCEKWLAEPKKKTRKTKVHPGSS